MPAPVISVVVLTFNRPEYTAATLDSLARHSGTTPRELIVVDNGSEEETRQILLDWQRRGLIDKLVFLGKNLGTSAGFNTGFSIADRRSRYLTKLDNDILVLSDDWIGKLLRVFDDVYDAGIVSMEMVNHAGIQALPQVERPGGHRLREWGGWVAGGSGMTFTRETYEKLGGFRTDFPEELKLMPDDLEAYHRVRKLGYNAYFCSAAQAHHQTHLDERYADYSVFKRRQYDLLSSRFFAVAADAESYDPWIVSLDLEPRRAKAGELVRAKVEVNASRPGQGGLGMTVRLAGSEPLHEIHDPQNDTVVQLAQGTHVYTRQFQLPAEAPAGTYDVVLGLYSHRPGEHERVFDHLEQPHLLELRPRS